MTCHAVRPRTNKAMCAPNGPSPCCPACARYMTAYSPRIVPIDASTITWPDGKCPMFEHRVSTYRQTA